MTVPRYRAIQEHWQRTPPLCVSAWVIAESLGAKRSAPPPKTGKARASAADDAERASSRQALIDMFGGTAGMALRRGKRPEWQTT